MTQRDAARRLGVGPMWVSERLSGATRITIDDLARFAALLNVPISSLLGEHQPVAVGSHPGGPTHPTPTHPPTPSVPGPAKTTPGRAA